MPVSSFLSGFAVGLQLLNWPATKIAFAIGSAYVNVALPPPEVATDAEPVPFTVLANPKLVMLTREVESDWEGCLSVPGMRGVVPRYTKLRYSGFDIEGNPFERVAEGFHARVVQHECDHLDGILYPQRMTDLSRFGFNEELFPGEELSDD